jgi:hypothetical protein
MPKASTLQGVLMPKESGAPYAKGILGQVKNALGVGYANGRAVFSRFYAFGIPYMKYGLSNLEGCSLRFHSDIQALPIASEDD